VTGVDELMSDHRAKAALYDALADAAKALATGAVWS
jgi:hypothetical protein